MTVKALTPVRMNLVEPLGHKPTDMRREDNTGSSRDRSSAVTVLIGEGLRHGDVDSSNRRSTRATTRGTRTSTTATRTPTTRTTSSRSRSSADSSVPCFESLVAAYMDCRKSKRNSTSALAFEARLERNLCSLYDELISGAYVPGRSICFVVTRPKPREVWAADFRDRVAHHLLYNHVAARFHAAFTADTCACIPGRGTLYAAKRLESQVRSITQNWARPAWYCKMDLANFFVAIDKRILSEQLAARIHEPWWLELARTILFHDPRLDVDVKAPAHLLRLVPPHKSLFNAPDDVGLPIGNLSSQFFANVYLDALDQFVKHQLRAPRHIRYVDDFVLLHESPDVLNGWLARIANFLPERLGAHLNPRKTILQPVDRGIDFVGHVIRPWCRSARPRILSTAIHRLERMPPELVLETVNSYFGLLRQSPKSHTDRARLANATRRRGHCVNASFTQTYRKASP